MNKTHFTYFLMIAIFAGGLWGILRVGSGLRAAPSVSGQWQFRWTDASPGDALPQRMSIDQSGRYLSAAMQGPAGPIRLNGRLASDRHSTARISLADPKSSWKLSARLDEGQLNGSLHTPSPHAMQARRLAQP